MVDFSLAATPGPYHIINYGLLLGAQIFQPVAGIIAFRVIPRPEFAKLQANTFPVYFAWQAVVPALLALTYPGEKTPFGTVNVGPAGLLAEENRLHVLAPLVTVLVTALVNRFFVLPASTKVMAERRKQENQDGKKSYDDGPKSPEMTALNKSFKKYHDISGLLQLSAIVATVWYGFTLGTRL
ncbi:MAG: hypothetical protein M1819_006140 [Sarea resinae]|nr:MAG: hypothetical protein M1819_006140 [Sarea resinae]